MSLKFRHEPELVSEDELRTALRSHKVAAREFEAGVRARIHAAELAGANDHRAGLSPFLKVAAALLPPAVLTSGNTVSAGVTSAAAAKLAPIPLVYKAAGIVALPAVSLFVMLGAAVFGAAKIRRVQRNNALDGADLQALSEATSAWRRQNKWLSRLFLTATFLLPIYGATALLLLLYLVSLGVMLAMLSGLARHGLADRRTIAGSCAMGMGLLGQASAVGTIGRQEIHLLDQMLLPAVLFAGALILTLLAGSLEPTAAPPSGKQQRFGGAAALALSLSAVLVWLLHPTPLLAVMELAGALLLSGILFVTKRSGGRLLIGRPSRTIVSLLVILPVIAWFTHPIWRPITPLRIKHYVEAFDEAPFSSASWAQWEVAASWAIETNLDPDLSGARRLLAAEISGARDPFVLGVASRVGLIRAEQFDELADGPASYEAKRRALFDDPLHVLATQPVASLNQQDWVVRASAVRRGLTSAERDLLEKRLHVNLKEMSTDPYLQLESPLRVTQLLEVIGRPIDRDRYRDQVHGWLRNFHALHCGFLQDSGGFKAYAGLNAGDLLATARAVELMEIYGVPNGVDLNWVRSFLRPKVMRFGDQTYMAAAALARLNRLPGVPHPTWFDYVYYERTLIMAVLLVALCVYAATSSPIANRKGSM